MKDGILILNKPQKWTSHDCVAVCRRVLGMKKIGHGGTLDPMAEGLLPVFIGKATRIMEYLDLDYKTYVCRVKLGVVTDTKDIWGEVLQRSSTDDISADDIEDALLDYQGYIEQIPPKYSALKVNGKKLYEYAREGKDVEIKSRSIHISSMKVLAIDMESMEASFEVKCSKGTYVRTICDDIGQKLGCGGTMAALTRTASGVFDLHEAISPEDMKNMETDEIEKLIMPVDRPLVHLGTVRISADRAKYFCSGNQIRWKQVKIEAEPDARCNLYKVYNSDDGAFLGTGYYFCDKTGDVLKADKIFAAKQ